MVKICKSSLKSINSNNNSQFVYIRCVHPSRTFARLKYHQILIYLTLTTKLIWENLFYEKEEKKVYQTKVDPVIWQGTLIWFWLRTNFDAFVYRFRKDWQIGGTYNRWKTRHFLEAICPFIDPYLHSFDEKLKTRSQTKQQDIRVLMTKHSFTYSNI